MFYAAVVTRCGRAAGLEVIVRARGHSCALSFLIVPGFSLAFDAFFWNFRGPADF